VKSKRRNCAWCGWFPSIERANLARFRNLAAYPWPSLSCLGWTQCAAGLCVKRLSIVDDSSGICAILKTERWTAFEVNHQRSVLRSISVPTHGNQPHQAQFRRFDFTPVPTYHRFCQGAISKSIPPASFLTLLLHRRPYGRINAIYPLSNWTRSVGNGSLMVKKSSNQGFRWPLLHLNQDGTKAWLLGCDLDVANAPGTGDDNHLSEIFKSRSRKVRLVG